MKLYLVRHGQSKGNAQSIHQGGDLDSELSELGLEQAEKLALRFSKYNFDKIYSSHLKRAHDTAKAIQKFHDHLDIILDERLKEKSHGVLTGKSKCDFYHGIDDKVNKKAEGGENFFDHRDRVNEFLKDLLKNDMDRENVLVVSHGGTLQVLLHLLMEIEPHIAYDKKKTPKSNACVYIVEIKENGNEILLSNCTKHLEE